MYKYYFLLCLLALARASQLDSYDEEDGEERTIFTSGGTYYIALNTTYLLLWSLLLGGILLGALFLAGGSGASADSGYGQYGGYGQKKSGFEEGFNRNKRDMFEYGKPPPARLNSSISIDFDRFLLEVSIQREKQHFIRICVVL